MTQLLDRETGETVADYATRMKYLVELIVGIVQSEADIGYDADEVIDELDFIIAHADDENWSGCWELRVEIERVISRMTSETRLNRVLYFAREMAG